MSEIGTKTGLCQIPKVPSITETVATWSSLSNVLQRDVLNDLEADEDNLLGSADIDVEPLKLVTNRAFLHKKITEALDHWEQLAERIPLKRQKTAGGSSDMFEDYDIDEDEIRTGPKDHPAAEEEDQVEVYRRCLRRIFCTIPRNGSLGVRMAEGSVPLRTMQVKRFLEDTPNRRPMGDIHLLNSVCKAPKEEDVELVGEPTSRGKDASAVAALSPSLSVDGKTPGEGSTDVERVGPSLSSSSRAMVTFVLYRSVSSDVSGLASATIPRICEVEALEHNTLQEVMEAMPACLSDRIADEERKGTSVTEPSTGPPVEKRSLSLAGGFLYIRGVFYVTKPTAGEDTRDIPPFPPPHFSTSELLNLKKEVKKVMREHVKLQKARENALVKKQERHLLEKKSLYQKRSKSPETWGSMNINSDSAIAERGCEPTIPVSEDASWNTLPWKKLSQILRISYDPAEPPDPWVKRWVGHGGTSWSTRKMTLLNGAGLAKRAAELSADAEALLKSSTASRTRSDDGGTEPWAQLREELEAVALAGAAVQASKEVSEILLGVNKGGPSRVERPPGRGRRLGRGSLGGKRKRGETEGDGSSSDEGSVTGDESTASSRRGRGRGKERIEY